MKLRELAGYGIIALVAGIIGCEDSAVLESLDQETSKLSSEMHETNQQLAKLARGLEDCETRIAEAQNDAPVVRRRDAMVARPRLMGDEDIEGLVRYKIQLSHALAEQRQRQTELHEELRKCGEELASSTADATTVR